MSSKNKKATVAVVDERLAGGFGMKGASQGDEALLRRSVMSCLLWENNAYIDGVSIAQNISKLIPKVQPEKVHEIAVEARLQQKLRHVPLFICREMAKLESHKHLVADTLKAIIRRPDEMTEFLSLYWADNGRKSLSAQVKRGLAASFGQFNEYQLAKYNREKEVKLRDVLRMCHPTPESEEQAALWGRLLKDELAIPDTWEVSLTEAHSSEEKKAVWERLIGERKLGASALLKNLRNMISVGVTPSVIRSALQNIKVDMLLPLDFLKAVQYAPDYSRELEVAMLKCAGAYNKLPGKTVLVVDVSGSMGSQLSAKSQFRRMDAAAAMAVLAGEISESVSIYATAGNDGTRVHKTAKVNPLRGFALSDAILKKASTLGGGGIFTRQCLEYIREQESEQPDRIIVFSDSQDCDARDRVPNPFGKRNYIVDISSHKYGINYKGVWTAEISGWSEGFLSYISCCENSNN